MGNKHGKNLKNTEFEDIHIAHNPPISPSKSKEFKTKTCVQDAYNEEVKGNQNANTSASGNSEDVRSKYKIENKELGHGHYGVVRKCMNRKTGEFYAIKTIKKSKVRRLDMLRKEVDILKSINHPNVIKCVETYEDDRFLHIIMELCTGGELFQRIINKSNSSSGHHSEFDTAVIIRCLLSAIEYCHTVHNISHRDMKPENILYVSDDEIATIKIIDFGLSRVADDTGSMTTRVGTPYYIAPEVLNRHYDHKCDIWSIGIIMYILLCGYPPFCGNNDTEIFTAIQNSHLDFPKEEWSDISDLAKDLIRGLLQKNPKDRLSAQEALQHQWLSSHMSSIPLSVPNIRDNLKSFVGMNMLKKCALQVIAEGLSESETEHLKCTFDRIDIDSDGNVSIMELYNAMKSDGHTDIAQEIEEYMIVMDRDNNKSISYKEFVAATMDLNYFIREDNIKKAFQFFDSDNSNSISITELTKVIGDVKVASEILNQLDINKDGVLSYDEFKAMMHGIPNNHNNNNPDKTLKTVFKF